MRRRKLSFLHCGTEVITDDHRIAVVDTHWSDSHVAIRYHYDKWPFPEWDRKARSQLTAIPVEYPDAPF